jgi:hypothetical protein
MIKRAYDTESLSRRNANLPKDFAGGIPESWFSSQLPECQQFASEGCKTSQQPQSGQR